MLHHLSSSAFKYVHRNYLVYNTCWEDPRLDREALDLGPNDKVVMITSAGCNALDYVLAGAGHVAAVDMNPRQNALLELKVASILQLHYEDFFLIFGFGRHSNFEHLYRQKLRHHLSAFARLYWDRHLHFFCSPNPRSTFYFRGSTGFFAQFINWYIDNVAHARELVEEILAAPSLNSQVRLYEHHLRPLLWTRSLRWLLDRNSTMALVGVPPQQRKQLEDTFGGGISRFVESALDAVFGRLSLQDNYFYRVYMTGQYTPQSCPEYLKQENFGLLKNRVSTALSTHTASLLEFLQSSDTKYSRFVLLDHMDWMSNGHEELLRDEWEAIVARATPGARIIWRSAGVRVEYVDPLVIKWKTERRSVGSLLHYHHERAQVLHQKDRVHTYGSFYIADLPLAA